MRTFADPDPTVWARAEGRTCGTTTAGATSTSYAGFAVANVGHCHPRVTAAIREQAGLRTHCPSAAPSGVRADLYERLVEIAPPGLDPRARRRHRALANELALQLARAATGRGGVHHVLGHLPRTLARGGARWPASTPTASPARGPCGRPVPAVPRSVPVAVGGRRRCRCDRARAGRAGARRSGQPASIPVAAIVIEPIQGNGGVADPAPGLPGRAARRLCDRPARCSSWTRSSAASAAPGRCGRAELEDVVPDLMTGREGDRRRPRAGRGARAGNVMTTWTSDAMTSTFLTNALNERAACRGDRRAPRRGARGAFAGARRARAARGCATASRTATASATCAAAACSSASSWAAPSPTPSGARAARLALRERGLIVGASGRHGNVLKLSPPLVIDEQELARRHRHDRGGPRMIDVRHLIGGAWVAGEPVFDVLACDDGSVLARVPEADADVVDRAVAAARAALPAWKARRGGDRAAVLLELADRLEAHLEPIARLVSREMGKPIRLTRVRELARRGGQAALLRGGGADAAGRRHGRLARPPARPDDPRAGRRRGADHPVERPRRPDRAQARRGARRGLHGGRQVLGGDACLDGRVPRAVRRPAGARSGRRQPRARPRHADRHSAGRASGRRQGVVHGLDGDRQGDHGRGRGTARERLAGVRREGTEPHLRRLRPREGRRCAGVRLVPLHRAVVHCRDADHRAARRLRRVRGGVRGAGPLAPGRQPARRGARSSGRSCRRGRRPRCAGSSMASPATAAGS